MKLRALTMPHKLLIASLGLICAAAGAIALWAALAGSKTPATPVVPADVSGHRTACLAASTADSAGDPNTNTVWNALQRAAQGRPLNLQRLVVPLSRNDQAGPYLAGLAAQRCDLIISIGPAFSAAIPAAAKATPHTRFLAVLAPGQHAPNSVATATGSPADIARTISTQTLALLNNDR